VKKHLENHDRPQCREFIQGSYKMKACRSAFSHSSPVLTHLVRSSDDGARRTKGAISDVRSRRSNVR